VSIKNVETGVSTEGVPLLYNETSLVLGEANDTVLEDDPTDDSRRLRGYVTAAVELNFGENKNFNWTIVDYQESQM